MCIIVVHLIRIEAEVLQIDVLDERTVGEHAFVREHDRVDMRHDVARQLLEIGKLRVQNS